MRAGLDDTSALSKLRFSDLVLKLRGHHRATMPRIIYWCHGYSVASLCLSLSISVELL